jgi:hypothetical protein
MKNSGPFKIGAILTLIIAIFVIILLGVIINHDNSKFKFNRMRDGMIVNLMPTVQELVKTHPRLQKICDLSGGCQNIELKCRQYDNTGNSNIKGLVVIEIASDVLETDKYKTFRVVGYDQENKSENKQVMDKAIESWLEFYEDTKGQHLKANPTLVYPNIIPCTRDCY